MQIIPRPSGNNVDPLAVLTDPPPDETNEERIARQAREAEARRISDEIDEGLRKDKIALKKERESIVKVLLLGQAESGKSTTLKNFRLRYTRNAWTEERASWRSVIQLNIIRSIHTILEALTSDIDPESPDSDSEQPSPSRSSHSRPSSTSPTPTGRRPPTPKLSEKHHLLKLRLAPLRRVEADLKRRLGISPSDEIDNINTSLPQPMYATPFDQPPRPATGAGFGRRRHAGGGGEVVVRSWKHVLQAEELVSGRGGRTTSPARPVGRRGAVQGATGDQALAGRDDATDVIAGCKDDMKALWGDDVVHEVLARQKVKLADSAEFFLGQLDRIASRSYQPSDDDVIRARLRTLGIQEHRLKFEGGVLSSGAESGRDWVIYDVGGSRTMRAAWLPYFDDVNAIIFLAPISCFDEHLAEDPSINRLEDTFILWKAICSSKQLCHTTLVVFMNKCDLLEKKIRKGVSVKKYLPSYGERSNDAAVFTKYLKKKFQDTSHQCSPTQRTLYLFATSVTDTKATAVTLKCVRDGILHEHLRQSDFV